MKVEHHSTRTFDLPKAPQLSRYLRDNFSGALTAERRINASAVTGWAVLYDSKVIGTYLIIYYPNESKILELTFAGHHTENPTKYVHLTYEKAINGYRRTDEFKDIPFP